MLGISNFKVWGIIEKKEKEQEKQKLGLLGKLVKGYKCTKKPLSIQQVLLLNFNIAELISNNIHIYILFTCYSTYIIIFSLYPEKCFFFNNFLYEYFRTYTLIFKNILHQK